MGAIEPTMANHDTNGHPFDHLLTNTKRERNPKHGRARRDIIQTFYSENEDSDGDGYHSPGINHEEAAWSPLSHKTAGPFEGPFSSFSEVCSASEPPQPSSCLNEPFSMPASREYPVKPQVSGRLDTPFDEPAFASTDASSPCNNAGITRSRARKYRPESSTSLSSKITREIKNFNGDEPAPTLRPPSYTHHGDVPLPLNTRGKRSTSSTLTKKDNLESNMNPPSRLVPKIRVAQQPHPVPPPRQVPQSRLLPESRLAPPQNQRPRRYISKKPPPLSLSKSSHKFSRSGSGFGADISSLSGEEIPCFNRPRHLEIKNSSYRQGGSKGHGKSIDDKPPFQRQNQQQQQLRRAQDSPVSTVSPVSHGPLGSPVSPIDKPQGLAQQKEISPIISSKKRDSPDSKVKIPNLPKLQLPQRVPPASSTKTEPGGHLTARFEFDLKIPIVTHDSETEGECDDPAMSENRKGKRAVRFKKTDITPIEECLKIQGFGIQVVDQKHSLRNFNVTYTGPECCYRMDNNEPEDGGYTRTIRYYAFVRDLVLPQNMAECKLIATFGVDYPPGIKFQVTLKEWFVDVSRVQGVRQR